jgi:UDP-glucose 4-epimerase
MENRKKVLVTGGAGFIGSHTVIDLIENGFEPIVVDDFRNSDELILEGMGRITGVDIPVHCVDLTDYEELRKVFKMHKFVGIIHFAAYKAVGESVDFPIRYYRNNLNALINVADLALEFKVYDFIFSSSCTLYEVPESNAAVNEETPLCVPDSPYAATKQMGERILSDIAKSNDQFKVLSLRYFNPVGAHESGNIGELPQGKPNNLLPFITQTAIGKQSEITVFGNTYNTPDGTCIRDYIHVCDIAEAHIAGLKWLMRQPKGVEEVVNLGTGEGKSVLEMISLFESITNLTLNWKLGPKRTGDKEQIFADSTKAYKLFNWKTKRTIEQAIRDAWNWEVQLMSVNRVVA